MDYLSITINPPPLEVQIVIKKSNYKIHNEARVDILCGNEASQDWHCGNLLAQGFDVWAFVNKEDKINYKKGEL